MSAVSYETLFPYVQPMVPSCPDPSIVIAIRNAVIEFCDETYYFNDAMDPILATAGTSIYEISVPTDYTLVAVTELYADGLVVHRKAPSELKTLYNGLDWQTIDGFPRYFTQFNTSEIVLCPKPDQTVTLTGHIAYTPTRASTTVEEMLINDYAEVLAQGALARIYAQPDQSYTNASAALMARREFMSGIANAKAYVRGGMSASTPQRVRFRRFW